MDLQPQLWIAGFAIGLLVGLTGMGGGALMTPFLVIVMKVQPIVAVGTDLVQMTVTKLFGAWQHTRQGTVNYRLVFLLAFGSIPGALLGVLVITLLSRQYPALVDDFVSRSLGIVLIIVAFTLLVTLLAKKKLSHTVNLSEAANDHRHITPLIGAAVGFLVAVTSVGSGSLFLILLLLIYRMRLSRVVGTDIVHAFLLVTVASTAHLAAGHVNFSLAGNILLGSIPGVLIGSRLTMRISETYLRTAIASVLLLSGVKLLL